MLNKEMVTTYSKLIISVASIASLIVVVYYTLDLLGVVNKISNVDQLKASIQEFGVWGPATLISIMALAIIVNPIPSAPIALASGALYGHYLGTFYIIVGATLGAMCAFTLSRKFGYGVLSKVSEGKHQFKLTESQNTLMFLVFVSRLIPFVSFDLMSYAAGFSKLSGWRFFLATLTGLVPASFLLAHFGGAISSSNFHQATMWLLLVGLLTMIPVAVRYYSNRLNEPKELSNE